MELWHQIIAAISTFAMGFIFGAAYVKKVRAGKWFIPRVSAGTSIRRNHSLSPTGLKMQPLIDEEIIADLYRLKASYKNTHAYVTTADYVTLNKWQGHNGQPEYLETIVPPGTTLKIVMVSRFGDCGLTDDLSAENGYHIRLQFDSPLIKDLRWEPEQTPDPEPSPTRYELLKNG